MSTTTSRRNALALVATLPALAVPAAVAAMGSPDAELIALGREFDRLALVINDCFRRSSAAYDQAKAMMIEAPDALRPKVGDMEVGLRPPECSNVGDGLYGHFDVSGYIRGIDHLRAREIVRDYDLWNASQESWAYERSGCNDIGREIDTHYEAIKPIEQRIIALPARTIEGMKVKARVTFFCAVGNINDDDDQSTYGLSARSIVIDLLRMQGTAPMSDFEYVRVGAQQLFSQTQRNP
jgi:hypothetical protein